MTIGVSFDGKHCHEGYGMFLTNVVLSQPTPQTSYIEIPGRNGLLDISEALSGEMKYENRTLEMTFSTTAEECGKSWNQFLSDISNDLHGQQKEIVFDNDPDWHLVGRCSVDGTPTAGGLYEITVTCDCEPFMYDANGNQKL